MHIIILQIVGCNLRNEVSCFCRRHDMMHWYPQIEKKKCLDKNSSNSFRQYLFHLWQWISFSKK
jgi:hypothetical protein